MMTTHGFGRAGQYAGFLIALLTSSRSGQTDYFDYICLPCCLPSRFVYREPPITDFAVPYGSIRGRTARH